MIGKNEKSLCIFCEKNKAPLGKVTCDECRKNIASKNGLIFGVQRKNSDSHDDNDDYDDGEFMALPQKTICVLCGKCKNVTVTHCINCGYEKNKRSMSRYMMEICFDCYKEYNKKHACIDTYIPEFKWLSGTEFSLLRNLCRENGDSVLKQGAKEGYQPGFEKKEEKHHTDKLPYFHVSEDNSNEDNSDKKYSSDSKYITICYGVKDLSKVDYDCFSEKLGCKKGSMTIIKHNGYIYFKVTFGKSDLIRRIDVSSGELIDDYPGTYNKINNPEDRHIYLLHIAAFLFCGILYLNSDFKCGSRLHQSIALDEKASQELNKDTTGVFISVPNLASTKVTMYTDEKTLITIKPTDLAGFMKKKELKKKE